MPTWDEVRDKFREATGEELLPEDTPTSEIITAPASDGPQMSVEYFEGQVAHKPYSSMLEVHKKQDGLVYYLAQDTPQNIRYRKQLGYQVVQNVGPEEVDHETGAPDGRVMAGGMVLMARPEEYHRMHMKALENKAAEMRRGPVESFKSTVMDLTGEEPIDEMRESRGPLGPVQPGEFSRSKGGPGVFTGSPEE